MMAADAVSAARASLDAAELAEAEARTAWCEAEARTAWLDRAEALMQARRVWLVATDAAAARRAR